MELISRQRGRNIVVGLNTQRRSINCMRVRRYEGTKLRYWPGTYGPTNLPKLAAIRKWLSKLAVPKHPGLSTR